MPIVAVLATAAALPAPAAAAECASAQIEAGRGNLSQVRSSVLCLVNVERAERGLAPVKASGKLRRAAGRHSADMVRRRYFSHVSPEGLTLVERARRVRYIAGGTGWQVAENLGWAPAGSATPANLVRWWMQSPPHRRNILRAGMRDLGVGLALGTPEGVRGVTGTLLFGSR